MTSKYDNYQYLGIGLVSFGVPFAIYSYWVLVNVTFSAFGLSCIILGATLLMVPSTPVPSHHIRAMLEGSLVNIEALLEEYDVYGKAVYLASVDGRVNCFVPINEQEETLRVKVENFPLRVLTKMGDVSGLLVFPPGSEIVRLARLPDDIELEDALSFVLVDYLEVVNSVKSVREVGDIVVELVDSLARSDFPRVNKSLGSIPVSVAGCVIAYVTAIPVVFIREEVSEGKVVGFFRYDV